MYISEREQWMTLSYQWPWDIASGVTVGKVIVLAGSTFCDPWFSIQPAGDRVLEHTCPCTHKPTCFLLEICGSYISQVFL